MLSPSFWRFDDTAFAENLEPDSDDELQYGGAGERRSKRLKSLEDERSRVDKNKKKKEKLINSGKQFTYQRGKKDILVDVIKSNPEHRRKKWKAFLNELAAPQMKDVLISEQQEVIDHILRKKPGTKHRKQSDAIWSALEKHFGYKRYKRGRVPDKQFCSSDMTCLERLIFQKGFDVFDEGMTQQLADILTWTYPATSRMHQQFMDIKKRLRATDVGLRPAGTDVIVEGKPPYEEGKSWPERIKEMWGRILYVPNEEYKEMQGDMSEKRRKQPPAIRIRYKLLEDVFHHLLKSPSWVERGLALQMSCGCRSTAIYDVEVQFEPIKTILQMPNMTVKDTDHWVRQVGVLKDSGARESAVKETELEDGEHLEVDTQTGMRVVEKPLIYNIKIADFKRHLNFVRDGVRDAYPDSIPSRKLLVKDTNPHLNRLIKDVLFKSWHDQHANKTKGHTITTHTFRGMYTYISYHLYGQKDMSYLTHSNWVLGHVPGQYSSTIRYTNTVVEFGFPLGFGNFAGNERQALESLKADVERIKEHKDGDIPQTHVDGGDKPLEISGKKEIIAHIKNAKRGRRKDITINGHTIVFNTRSQLTRETRIQNGVAAVRTLEKIFNVSPIQKRRIENIGFSPKFAREIYAAAYSDN
jgi:hypothetical protein